MNVSNYFGDFELGSWDYDLKSPPRFLIKKTPFISDKIHSVMISTFPFRIFQCLAN